METVDARPGMQGRLRGQSRLSRLSRVRRHLADPVAQLRGGSPVFRRTRWHRADADDSPTRCAADSTQVVNSQFSDGLPWTPEGKDVAGETVPVTVSSADLVSTLGLEAVADRNPDVIFAGYLPEQETYDKLAAIAPIVATVGEGMVDDWREATTVAGEIVDKEEDAADAIEGTDSGRGRAVSAENIDMLDVDFLALWISGETPDDLPGWSDLHAVERGSAPQLDTVASTALGAPSVLSIPWVLDQLDPYLAALQEGDDE